MTVTWGVEWLTVFGYRARLHKGLCSFAAAEADLRALLDVRPSHTGAAKELQEVAQGRQGLERSTSAAASRYACTCALAAASVCITAMHCTVAYQPGLCSASFAPVHLSGACVSTHPPSSTY